MFINTYIYLPLHLCHECYIFFLDQSTGGFGAHLPTTIKVPSIMRKQNCSLLRSKEPSLPNVMSLTVPPPIVEGGGWWGRGWSGGVFYLRFKLDEFSCSTLFVESFVCLFVCLFVCFVVCVFVFLCVCCFVC